MASEPFVHSACVVRAFAQVWVRRATTHARPSGVLAQSTGCLDSDLLAGRFPLNSTQRGRPVERAVYTVSGTFNGSTDPLRLGRRSRKVLDDLDVWHRPNGHIHTFRSVIRVTEG